MKLLLSAFYACLFFICVTSSLWAQHQQSALYFPNQLLVKYKNEAARTKSLTQRQALGIQKKGEIPQENLELWVLPHAATTVNGKSLMGVEAWMQILEQNPDIEAVQPNYVYGTAYSTPNDTAFYRQWALENTGWNSCESGNDIKAMTAWDVRDAAKYTKVGILDTGMDWKHADLQPNVWQNLKEDADGDSTVLVWNGSTWVFDPGDQNGIDDDLNGYVDDFIGWDFANNDNNPMDDNGHGTHVSGIIGAKSNNSIGIAGIVGGGVQMMPLKILDESGSGSTYSTLLALQYAVNQSVTITNNSYGGGAYDAMLFNYINTNCKNAGQLFIAAAGNRAVDNDVDPLYPASYESDIIISVAAHTCHLTRAAFSNYGSSSVHIFAPGDAIYSTDLDNTYSYRSGTSMAAPHITGAAVLAWKQFPNSTADMIRNRLLSTAKAEPALSNLCQSSGRLNLFDALVQPDFYTTGSNEWEVIYSGLEVNDMSTTGDYIWVATNIGFVKINALTEESNYYNKTNSQLPSNYLNAVCAANNGIVWVGTEAEGVGKYDGSIWSNYNTSNSGIAFNTIDILTLSPTNSIWIGNNTDGICTFNGTTWTTYTTSNSGLISNNVNAMQFDAAGNLWIRTYLGLSKFNGTTWTNYDNTDFGLNSSLIIDLAVDNNTNTLWITTSEGVASFNGTTWTAYTTSNSGLVDNWVYSVAVESNGTVWFSAGQGTCSYNGSTWTTYNSLNSGLAFDETPFLSIDSYDKKWFISVGEFYIASLSQLADTTWNNISLANSGLASNEVNTLFMDSQDNKWFGTSKGISKFDGINWITYDTSNSGLVFNDVTVINQDAGGNMWFGTKEGLSKFDGTTWISIDTLAGEHVVALTFESSGTLWIANYNNNVYRYDGSTWTIYNSGNSGIVGTNIFCLEIDHLNNVWIGTEEGVSKFNGTNWISYNTGNSGLNSGYINTIEEDNLGNIWMGAFELYKFDGSTWTSYNPSNSGFTGTCVQVIKADAANNIWVGTCPGSNEGVHKFDGTNWTIYTSNNSGIMITPDSYVGGIAIDSADNKWFAALGVAVLYDSPVSFSTSKLTVCQGETLTFNNNNTNSTSYEWKVDGASVATTTNLTYTFSSVGIHQVELLAYKGSTSKSYFQFITVRNAIEVNLGQDTSLCASSFFIQPEIGVQSFSWQNLSGTVLDTMEYFEVTGSGVHTIILEVTDYCGAIDRDTVVVTLSGGCVLPGDVNSDGAVDIIDYLTLPYINGRTGAARTNATTNLKYETCTDWATTFNGVNDKHGDCTGNGIIEVNTGAGSDDSVVLKNANRSIPRRIAVAASPYSLKLIKDEDSPFIWLGDTIRHSVELAREGNVEVGDVVKEVGFSLRYNLNFDTKPFVEIDSSFLKGTTYSNNVAGGVIRKGKKADFGIMGVTGGGGGGGTVAGVGSVPKNKDIDTTHTTHSIFFTMTTYNAVISDNTGTDTLVLSSTAHNTETIEMRLPWNDLQVKVLLQGAYDSTTQMMTNYLSDSHLLPYAHPYDTTYYAPFGEVEEIPSGVVDWVLVELRSSSDLTSEGQKDIRAAFVMEDGSLKDAKGGDNLYMLALAGDYYLVIHHRNHLSVMSANPISLSGTDTSPVIYDFTSSPTMAYGTDAQVYVGNGKYGMYAGDVNDDGELIYEGTDSDADAIYNAIYFESDPCYTIPNTYSKEDTNFDGTIQYSGQGNDRAIILRNVGGTDPFNTKHTNVPD